MEQKQIPIEEAVTKFPLPEGYEDRSEGFARAYAHARSYSEFNSEKVSLLFAERWEHEFEPTGVITNER
jgi:hypothetical protein